MGTELYPSSQRLYLPLPYHITGIGRFGNFFQMKTFAGINSTFAAGAWSANNLAIYQPISLPSRFTVARFMSANGSNITGNTDIGLYDGEGNLLISTGTTARANAGAMQYIGVTDQSFPAGHYYLAMVLSSTSGTVFTTHSVVGSIMNLQACGFLQEALGSTVLPLTMTPVQYTSAAAWIFGFTQSDTL